MTTKWECPICHAVMRRFLDVQDHIRNYELHKGGEVTKEKLWKDFLQKGNDPSSRRKIDWQTKYRMKPLTEREWQYIESHERDYLMQKLMLDLIYEWTDKDFAAQGRIISETPKDSNWRKLFVERSEGYMFKLAKRMTTAELNWTLNTITEIHDLGARFSDILQEERELRKRRDKTFSV